MLIRHSLAALPMLLVTLLLTTHTPTVNAEGTVYACASRYFGYMRLVKHPRKCRRRERLVTFPGASGSGSGGGDVEQLARIEKLESQNATLSNEVKALQEANESLRTRLVALQDADTTLGADIVALQDADAQLMLEMQQTPVQSTSLPENKLACISDKSTATDLVIEGCNLRIVNGLGSTDSLDGTGRGNLIIGYDEDGAGDKDRTGSHNLVVGGEHTYNSYGGLVAGYRNSITGANATVAGGSFNTASGVKSTVSGGYSNLASGDLASVSGGAGNRATGGHASVSGGFQNRASGAHSSVTGGAGNLASAQQATVSGGGNNEAAASQASVSGGTNNYAAGASSSILGGGGYETMFDNETVPPL